MSRPSTGVVAFLVVLVALPASATRPRVHVLESSGDFADGTFDGTSLSPDGEVTLGPGLKSWVSQTPGPVLALATMPDGTVYASTAAPARVYRMFADKAPELVVEIKAPLVTSLIPLGPKTLVALSSADGAAHFISLGASGAGTVTRSVSAPDVKFLLAGVADGETLFVVGGGESGVLLELPPGATKWNTLGTVKEKTLRSIARAPVAGRRGLVVGGADDGIIYLFDGKSLRALVDAEPGEVTALAVDAKGRIFASLVDAAGKVTDGATARDTSDDKDASKSAAKPKEKKPRKVKSAEVLRIDPDGSVHVLWQSKKNGAYALHLEKRGLFVGTGAEGQVLLLDVEGKLGATVLGSATDGDEIVAIAAGKSGALLLGTAHGGGVVAVDGARRTKGTFTSSALDAKAIARYGHLDWSGTWPAGSRVSFEVRTGGTSEPDDSWGTWSPVLAKAGVPLVPAARFAQVRATLEAPLSVEPTLSLVRFAHLSTNRPPEISDVEVVAPGFKVRFTERERSETRSVTFGKGAFKKFATTPGSAAPVLEERPSGKQSAAPGHRAVYAFVEDPDGDALRYRFALARVDASGNTGAFVVVKEWSEEPFVSLDMARLKDGAYRVQIQTDDALTNGPVRALSDARVSPVFVVAHQPPRFTVAKAVPQQRGVRVVLDVEAMAPLALVTCSVGGDEWLPIDPSDGILDTARERFDAVLPTTPTEPALKAASCMALDEAGNEARTDLAW
jgi:hypothetical protein